MTHLILALAMMGQTSPSTEEICLMQHSNAYCEFMAHLPAQTLEPVKCGKYQHVGEGQVCVDDLHVHTEREREWQMIIRQITFMNWFVDMQIKGASGTKCIIPKDGLLMEEK